MLQDLRFVVRSLARSRGFTAVTVITLALGIGSAAAIFGVTDWILFRANRPPDNVYVVGGQLPERQFSPMRLPFMVNAYQERKDIFAEFSKARNQAGNIVINGEPIASSWLGVSANLLPMLGVSPRLGRNFRADEEASGSNAVVIISDWFWHKYLDGDLDVLGRKITVGDAICTVVGVLAPGQRMPGYLNRPLYRLAGFAGEAKDVANFRYQMFVLARLHPGMTRAQAEAGLRTLHYDAPPPFSQIFEKERVVLGSLGELDRWLHPEVFWLMLGAVGFLYAIACLNASNLMLVRTLGQRRDFCVRLALGGGSARLIRLLACESFVLVLVAVALGALLSTWFFPVLLRATGIPASSQIWETGLGWRTVGVLGLLSVVTSFAIALLPALRLSRFDISSGLKDGGAALGESPSLARLRGLLVVIQTATALVLLAGAGLMIHTFAKVQRIDPGFAMERRAKVYFSLAATAPTDGEAQLIKLRALQQELLKQPGVLAAGFAGDFLMPGWHTDFYRFAGPGGATVASAFATFSAGFPEVVDLKLKRGRWLTESRGESVLVSESLARAMWPDQDPIGQFLRSGDTEGAKPKGWAGWQVVGVVNDIRSSVREGPGNWIFGPEGSGPDGMTTFILKLGTDYNEGLASALRRRIYAFDPQILVGGVIPLEQLREDQLWAERMANSVFQVLAAIALFLTVAGIFSVLAYTVDRRMGEFGVRMALGATPRDLVQLVLDRGLKLTLLGIATGLAGALALGRFLKALLFESTANDPWVLGGVALVLVAAAALACVLPARRAARVDVSKLLRSE